jgi:ATP-binding cassette, subfamily C (CFTR/MRP), member 1
MFVGFVMLSNLFILFRASIMIISSTKQGKVVHDKMMKSLLYASLSNFFNRVPIGRIVNRLTKDLR